jgi:hypothetical protein
MGKPKSRAERRARAARRRAGAEQRRRADQRQRWIEEGMDPAGRELRREQSAQTPAQAPARTGKRPICLDKDLDRYVKAAWEAGWPVERGGTEHIKCTGPSGQIISVPSTPSRQRTLLRIRSAFRREGIEL